MGYWEPLANWNIKKHSTQHVLKNNHSIEDNSILEIIEVGKQVIMDRVEGKELHTTLSHKTGMSHPPKRFFPSNVANNRIWHTRSFPNELIRKGAGKGWGATPLHPLIQKWRRLQLQKKGTPSYIGNIWIRDDIFLSHLEGFEID